MSKNFNIDECTAAYGAMRHQHAKRVENTNRSIEKCQSTQKDFTKNQNDINHIIIHESVAMIRMIKIEICLLIQFKQLFLNCRIISSKED